jgi:hypothetical protein
MLKKSLIEFDDFIDPNIKIEIGATINPKAKLTDFSHIKISAIDPSVREEIKKRMKKIRGNLEKMKSMSC